MTSAAQLAAAIALASERSWKMPARPAWPDHRDGAPGRKKLRAKGKAQKLARRKQRK